MVSSGFPFGNIIKRSAAASEHQQGDARERDIDRLFHRCASINHLIYIDSAWERQDNQ